MVAFCGGPNCKLTVGGFDSADAKWLELLSCFVRPDGAAFSCYPWSLACKYCVKVCNIEDTLIFKTHDDKVGSRSRESVH